MAEKSAGSPLRAAAVTGHESTVRLLLEHGADTNEEYPLIEALRRGHKDIARLLVREKADVNVVQGFDFDDGIPFWLYALPTTRCLAQLMLSLFDISSLCLRPKKRKPSEWRGRVWEDSPLWVAAALGDAESVKLLLDHGANPNRPGPYFLTPLHIATMEEHEAVVQLLLAAGDETHSRVEDLENALEVETYVSREASRGALAEQETDRGSKIQTEKPVEAGPPNSSVAMGIIAQDEPRSSSPDLLSPQAPTSRGPGLLLRYDEGVEKTLDLFEILSKAKSEAKAEGDKRFGQFFEIGESLMHNPKVMRLILMDPDDLPSGRSNDGDSEGEVDEEEINRKEGDEEEA